MITAKYIIIVVAGLAYLIYTIINSINFRKNLIYTGRLKIFHLIMFWIVPFVWIWWVKSTSRSEKGSYEIEKKEDPISFGGHYNA